MTISHRLWVLVAETDLTGLWSVPRRKRFLPVLAGPLADVFSLSVLLLVFRAQSCGWITLSEPVLHFARAGAFAYVLRLVWQCFFFVRTDFYYALVILTGCTNLMRNTEIFLRNHLITALSRLRWLRRLQWFRAVPKESPPPREARTVRLYVPFYLAGRLLAFWSLVFITLPVTWLYIKAIATALYAGYGRDPVSFLDSLLLTSLALSGTLGGLFLWTRSLISRRSTTT